jgi:UDP-N-acetylmuramate dehydrogenase
MQFKENIPLKDYSNYKIGGPARYFFEAKTEDALARGAREAKRRGLALFVLGEGSNLLIDDAGFDGLVLKISFDGAIEFDGARVTVTPDILIPHLLDEVAKRGLQGLEWAGGLPGTVGGAVRGNAGAFGGETKDTIFRVRSYDMQTDSFTLRNNAECRFGYRSSVFKEKQGSEIITKVIFELKPGVEKDIRASIEDKIQFRKSKHPIEYPNIGSIFKNVPLEYFLRTYADRAQTDADGKSTDAEIRAKFPVKDDPFPVIPTAYLMSEAGLKGLSHGGAQISEKHPNFIINKGNATSADVEFLIGVIKKAVFEKFGVMLEEEVQRVG